jgi:DNA polymerase I-like protein with 3'-5' exonuclease and polymerase domains
MARGVSKKGRSVGPVSAQLEEFTPINFYVAGRPEWLASSFEEGALTEDQKIPIRSSSDLDEEKAWLRTQRIQVVDSETTGPGKYGGLEPRNPESRIVLYQIGTEDRVLMVEPELLGEFAEFLESEDYLKLGQNLVFDFEFTLAKTGMSIRRMFDTMLAEQLLTSGLSGTGVGMEDIVRRYYPHRLITKELRKQFAEFHLRPVFSRKMTYYAARDIVVLPAVMREQSKLLKQWKMETVAKDEFNCIPCTAMMELAGVPIDIRILQLAVSWWESQERMLVDQILNHYDSRVSEMGERAIFLIPGMREVFDVKSSSQKLEALRRLGIELEDTKRDTLESINDPLAKLLVRYSEAAKVVSTYGQSLIDRVDKETGRLYPEFHQLGAGDFEMRSGRVKKSTIATGRYSSDFQQLPRGDERYEEVKDPEIIKLLREKYQESLAEIMEAVTA